MLAFGYNDRKSVHFQNHFILFSSLKKLHWFYTCSSGLLKSKWGNGQCAYHSFMHWFTPLLREKIQMNVLVRINNLQPFVLWVLSYIHHLCPVTFWSRVSDQSGREGACFFAIIPILWSHFKIDLYLYTRDFWRRCSTDTVWQIAIYLCVCMC